MKTGIIFLIHWAIVFVILLIYAFLTHNTMNIRSVSGVVFTAAVISGILLLFTKTTNVHENFLFPCKINHGAYVIPRNYGYSATIKKEAIDSYKYPNGSFWIQNIDK